MLNTKQDFINQTINDILDNISNNTRLLCNRYTGFGKTYNVIPKIITALNSEFIIVVPNLILFDQYKKIYEHDNSVHIITYQTLAKRTNKELEQYKDVKYIICEEAHRLGAKSWLSGINRLLKITNAKVIGFTATPIRGDGNNILNSFFNNNEIQPITLLDAINYNIAPKIEYIIAYAELSNEKSYNKLSDIDRYKISNLLNVENILKKHIPISNLEHNLKILVFVPQLKYISEAKQKCNDWFSKIYPNKHINLYQLSSKDCLGENRYQLQMFSNNKNDNDIDILVSVNKLTEGLHLPEVAIEIMLRKTQSPVTYFQQLGRVINGDTPIVFDLINNSKHLYTIKHECSNNSIISGNKEKITFGDYVNLFDETEAIENILNKYRLMSSEEILNIINSNMDYIINNPDNLTCKGIAKKLGIAERTFNSYIKKLNIKINNITPYGIHNVKIQQYKDYILKNPDNLTIYEMSVKLNVSYGSLSAYLARNNIKHNNKIDNKTEKDIIIGHKSEIELNQDGLTKGEWAKKLNINYRAFNKYIKSLDIDTTNIKQSKNIINIKSDDEYLDVINNYKKDLSNGEISLKQLANKYELNVNKLSAIAKINNINIYKKRKTITDDYIKIIEENYNFLKDNINKLDRQTLIKAINLNANIKNASTETFFRTCNYMGIKNSNNNALKHNTLAYIILDKYSDFIKTNENILTGNQIVNYILEHENMTYNKRTSVYSAIKRLKDRNLI